MRNRVIELLDEADLFLRNRANAKSAHLNNYDVEMLKNVAKVCDEAARTLEKAIIPPCKVGARVYAVITNMPLMPAGVYECEVTRHTLYEDGIKPTVEIKGNSIFNGVNLGLYPEDLFTSMAAAQTILEAKKQKMEKEKQNRLSASYRQVTSK